MKGHFSWNKWAFFVSLLVWVGVVFGVNPTVSGLGSWLIFYASFGLTVFFGVNWLGLKIISGEIEEFTRIRLRRWGKLVSLMCIGLLLLQQFRVLFWWIGLLWLAFILLIELISRHNETVND